MGSLRYLPEHNKCCSLAILCTLYTNSVHSCSKEEEKKDIHTLSEKIPPEGNTSAAGCSQ